MEIASTLTDTIEAAGLGGEYQVHAGCGQGLLLRRTHRRRLRSGAPMQSRASPRRARRSWFGLAAVLGAGQLAAMPCAGSVHEPAPGINKISASARRRVAPAGADGRSRRAAGGLAARDRFIAAPAVGPALLLRALPDAKQKPVLAVERELDGWAWVIAAVVSAPSTWLLLLTAPERSAYRTADDSSVPRSLRLLESHNPRRRMTHRRCRVERPGPGEQQGA